MPVFILMHLYWNESSLALSATLIFHALHLHSNTGLTGGFYILMLTLILYCLELQMLACKMWTFASLFSIYLSAKQSHRQAFRLIRTPILLTVSSSLVVFLCICFVVVEMMPLLHRGNCTHFFCIYVANMLA